MQRPCDEIALQARPAPTTTSGFRGIPTLRQLARMNRGLGDRGACRTASRARAGAHRQLEQLASLAGDAGADGLSLPVRQPARPVGHRLQRRRTPARRRLLRSAGLRSAPGQLRGHRAGADAAGALVHAGPPADENAGGEPSALLDRLDVRIPDAHAGDAQLRRQLAGPDLPRRRGGADRIRQALGIPWGVSESGYNTIDAHFNYQYRAFGVPGLGLKRGLGDDRGDRALRQRTGVDDCAGRGLQEPATPGQQGVTAVSACTKRWITPRRGCRGVSASRWSSHSWRITRA